LYLYGAQRNSAASSSPLETSEHPMQTIAAINRLSQQGS
jgi:hypothetical protein